MTSCYLWVLVIASRGIRRPFPSDPWCDNAYVKKTVLKTSCKLDGAYSSLPLPVPDQLAFFFICSTDVYESTHCN